MSVAPTRPGRIPNDLAVRLDQATSNFEERIIAKRVAAKLAGRQPDWFKGSRLRQLEADLDGVWTLPELERALDVLHEVGYGQPTHKRRRDRAHGTRLHDRLDGIIGLLPRSLALRYPTTDDRHASGPLEGTDVYGAIAVNHTPRDGHLGLIAAAFALWRHRSSGEESYVDLTRGELAYLLRAGRRITQRTGGGDVQWIDGLIGALASEQITAKVTRGNRGEASQAHAIPSAPISRIQARIDGHFLEWEAYRELADHQSLAGRCGQQDTLRVHFAPWALAEITHAERRPVYLNFATWRGLSGTGRRLYALLQASTVREVDGHPALYLYLAPALRFTLGLRGGRPDKAAAILRHQLTDLYHRDERYHHVSTQAPSGFRQRLHPGTTLPAFMIRVQQKATSRPRAGWRDRPPTPRRPLCSRPGPHAAMIVSPFDIPAAQVPTDLRERDGFERARAHIARIRTQTLSVVQQLPLPPEALAAGTPARPPARPRAPGDPPGR